MPECIDSVHLPTSIGGHDLDPPVALNDCVEVAYSPLTSLRGSVVWVNGGNCGIAFEGRLNRARQAAHYTAGAVNETKVRRTTATGDDRLCEGTLRHPALFLPGLRVSVLLGGGRERPGVVRWTQDNIAEFWLP